MSTIEVPASADERNASTAKALEKSYHGTLISTTQLKEEAPAFYWWLHDIFHFRTWVEARKYFFIFRKVDVSGKNVPGEGPEFKDEVRYWVHLFTAENRYHISAIPPSEERPNGYLGADVTMRKSYAGEDHHRGNDLADGHYDQDTWRMIQSDIINYELAKLECWI